LSQCGEYLALSDAHLIIAYFYDRLS